jgi:hypothetical protein
MKPAILAAAIALAAGGAAQAEPDATRSDVRCLLAFSTMLKNPAYKDAAGAGLFYFVGRIDARDPKFDLGAAMKREIGNMQTSDYVTEAQRCGAVLKQRNEDLKAAGEAAKAR